MKITTNGNSAIIEYPYCEAPEFELDDNGILMIFGYKMRFGIHEIGTAQRYETGLKNYKIIGKYNESIINKEIDAIIKKGDIDLNNCILLYKNG